MIFFRNRLTLCGLLCLLSFILFSLLFWDFKMIWTTEIQPSQSLQAKSEKILTTERESAAAANSRRKQVLPLASDLNTLKKAEAVGFKPERVEAANSRPKEVLSPASKLKTTEDNEDVDLCTLWAEKRSGDKTAIDSTPNEWWQYLCELEREWDDNRGYKCQDVRSVGGYRICVDIKFNMTAPCLVYSFGINKDFTFDDYMVSKGCEVFSFDPSDGVPTHRRSKRAMFYSMGIGTQDNDNFTPLDDAYTRDKNQIWQIKTLASIKKMLGHEKKTLDVLKLDVETYEWDIIKQLLEDGTINSVRQLLIEWHIFPHQPSRSKYPEMLTTFKKLKTTGFQLYEARANNRRHSAKDFNTQCDSSFVNSRFPKV